MPIDPETRAAGIALLLAGSSHSEVARKLGVSRSAVTGWARASGVRERLRRERLDRALELLQLGEPVREVAKTVSLAESALRKQVAAAGITRRDLQRWRRAPAPQVSSDCRIHYARCSRCHKVLGFVALLSSESAAEPRARICDACADARQMIAELTEALPPANSSWLSRVGRHIRLEPFSTPIDPDSEADEEDEVRLSGEQEAEARHRIGAGASIGEVARALEVGVHLVWELQSRMATDGELGSDPPRAD